jgi:Leucine-rich repeat (LRR) protein
MKKLSIIVVCITILLSCDKVIDSKYNDSIANAGEDQETYVGSYAVLDASKSKLAEGEVLAIYEWVQDSNNPQEMFSIFSSSLTEPRAIAFEKEGKYKFTLTIKCKSGNIYTDDVVVTVKPRQIGLIEDLFLEARIRYKLNYKKGELTSNKLAVLDSLSYPEFYITNIKTHSTYKTKSIKGVENCTDLRYLALASQSITDLQPLANLVKLEYLDLNQNYTVEDISPIYNLVNLKTLILYSNPIKDISGLGNLTKLTYLNLLYTPIYNLSSLSSLVNLKLLYLSGVGEGITFNSIEPLKNLRKLEHLHLKGGNITDITPLENLTELDLLNVSFNNFITKISAVSKMKKLVRLYIGRNKVEDISGIKNLENLDFLDAADNQIKDITELQYLPKIHLIGLSRNKIEDILPLVNNPYLGKGVYLFLHGNPLNEKSINEYIPVLIARGIVVYWK